MANLLFWFTSCLIRWGRPLSLLYWQCMLSQYCVHIVVCCQTRHTRRLAITRVDKNLIKQQKRVHVHLFRFWGDSSQFSIITVCFLSWMWNFETPMYGCNIASTFKARSNWLKCSLFSLALFSMRVSHGQTCILISECWRLKIAFARYLYRKELCVRLCEVHEVPQPEERKIRKEAVASYL